MAINNLNLFVDRDNVQPPERPQKVVVEDSSMPDELDSFFEEFAEEITGEKRKPIREVRQPQVRQQRKVQPQPVLQEEVFVPNQPVREKNYIDRSADRLSQFIGDFGGAVQINEVNERFNLLEAEISKIRQMTKAQFPGNPGNTIVSGIGNSGDGSTPGGGAVWLWDLDDVSIGTPLNGQYPTITDGDVLKYNAGTGKWIAGEGAQANILEGGIINANGGSANTTGDVVIQATTPTNGNLEITNISATPTVKFFGVTGNTDFKGGFIQIDRLAANSSIGNSNFTIHGRSQSDIDANTYTNAGNIFYGYTSHPQDTGTADAIQYDGRVSQPLDMVNKKYVDSAIDTGGGGIGFTFKGTCDVTLPLDNAANSAVAEAEGNFYINTAGGTAYNSGTAAQNWKGIGGATVAADQLIIWSESADRWFAGAVENDTTYVKVDGSNPMTGGLTIDVPASGSEGLTIKNAGTTSITLFKGGTAEFNNDITANANISCGGNIKPQADATKDLGSDTLQWKNGYIKSLTTTSHSTMASISPNGSQNLGSLNERWQIIFGSVITLNDIAPLNNSTSINIGASGGLEDKTNGTYNFLGGASANTVFHRCSSSAMTDPQWTIRGKTTANDGDPTKDLLAVYRVTGSSPDVIEYHGTTEQQYDLVNKKYVDLGDWFTTQSAVINDPPWGSHTNKYRINSEKTVCYVYLNISASGSSATVQTGAVLTAGIVGSSSNWPPVDTPFTTCLTDSSGNRQFSTNNYVRASDGKIIMQGPFVAKTITANFSFNTVTGI